MAELKPMLLAADYPRDGELTLEELEQALSQLDSAAICGIIK